MVLVPDSIPHGTSLPRSVTPARTVLIFSPDADLARTLVLNLEEKYAISRESTLPGLADALSRGAHDLILVDLYTFSEEVDRLLVLLRKRVRKVPVIVLRGYIPLRKEINAAIEQMSSTVFYKPLDVDLVSEVIENLLGQEQKKRASPSR